MLDFEECKNSEVTQDFRSFPMYSQIHFDDGIEDSEEIVDVAINSPFEAFNPQLQRVKNTLKELATFQQNWNGHNGQPLNCKIRDLALDFFGALPTLPKDIVMYPTQTGALAFELNGKHGLFTGIIEQGFCMSQIVGEEPRIFENGNGGIEELTEETKTILVELH